ncbi:hypothetical protein K474DRAFT_1669715 [Panus rudis PR-1116 ss-1]|nr:hypothetical protein K474DRAFT_1669715 [Panus rudis PR-1116 ss-1]
MNVHIVCSSRCCQPKVSATVLRGVTRAASSALTSSSPAGPSSSTRGPSSYFYSTSTPSSSSSSVPTSPSSNSSFPSLPSSHPPSPSPPSPPIPPQSHSQPHSQTQAPPQPQSTVHRGTAFEHRSLRILQDNLSMSLRRVGGRSDGGVDLVGWWWVPTATAMESHPGSGGYDGLGSGNDSSGSTASSMYTRYSQMTESMSGRQYLNNRRRIRVLAQCKMETKKIGPKYIREMEGVMHRYIFSSPSSLSSSSPNPPLDSEPASKLKLEPSSKGESSAHSDPETNLDVEREEEEREVGREPVMALFISSSPFTKAALLRVYSSPIPFMLLHLPPSLSPPLNASSSTASTATLSSIPSPSIPSHEQPGRDSSTSKENSDVTSENSEQEQEPTTPNDIGSIIFNPALSGTNGLLRGAIEPRWERSPSGGTGGGGTGRPGLWWNGKRIPSWTPGV